VSTFQISSTHEPEYFHRLGKLSQFLHGPHVGKQLADSISRASHCFLANQDDLQILETPFNLAKREKMMQQLRRLSYPEVTEILFQNSETLQKKSAELWWP
jgi:hypothetical protein